MAGQRKNKLTNDREDTSGLEHTHHSDDELDSPRRVDHHDLSSLETSLNQPVSDDVGRLIDSLVVVGPPILTGPLEDVSSVVKRLDDAGTVGVSSRVGGEDVGDGSLEA